EPAALATFHGVQRDDPKTLDPAGAYDSISLGIVAQIYEGLLQYDYRDPARKLVPLLADGMPKLSRDGLTLSISIKRGIHFQDDPCFKASGGKGREATADDFVFALKRMANPSVSAEGWWILDHHVVGANSFRERLAKVSDAQERRKLFDGPLEGI